MTSFKIWLLAALSVCIVGTNAIAQSPFDAVVRVGNHVVTQFELSQRQKFYEALGINGSTFERSRNELIEDRLKEDVFQQLGISISSQALVPELEAFAQRADLGLGEFLEVLRSNGVADETFEAYVRVNVLWREVIRTRFGARAVPSDAEIDRAASAAQTGNGLNIRLAEIIIPHRPDQLEEARGLAKTILTDATEASFSAAARRYSATQSRENGGLLPWTSIAELPPPVRAAATGLRVGETLPHFEVDGAIILFQVRGLAERAYTPQVTTAVDYVTFTLPTASVPATLATIDVCDDVYGATTLSTAWTTAKPAELDKSTQIILSRLDPNETYVSEVDAERSQVIMLCGRNFALTPAAENREAVAQRLRSQRLQTLSDGYLAELRSRTTITFE